MSERPARSVAVANAWAALALVSGSIEPIAAKIGFRGEASVWDLQLARSIVAAAVILPLTRRLTWLPRSARALVVLAGGLLFTTTTSMLFALSRLPVADVISILSITPATVALVARWRSGVSLGPHFALGLGLSIVGVAFTTGAFRGDVGDGLGIACAFGAVASSTVYRLTLERVTASSDPAVVSSWVYLIHGALALALVAPVVGMPSSAAWAAGSWTGIAAAVSNVAFVAALAGLGAPRASVVMLLQRPIIVVAAAMILSEALGIEELVGIGLVVAGVALSGRRAAPASDAK